MPAKSYDNACWIYISMKNAANIFQKSIQDTRVAIVGGRIPMDLDTIQILWSRIRMDLLPYCEGGSMIPVDLRQTVSVGFIIWMDPGSRSLRSDPGIRFRDPRTCLITTLTIPSGGGGADSSPCVFHFSFIHLITNREHPTYRWRRIYKKSSLEITSLITVR